MTYSTRYVNTHTGECTSVTWSFPYIEEISVRAFKNNGRSFSVRMPLVLAGYSLTKSSGSMVLAMEVMTAAISCMYVCTYLCTYIRTQVVSRYSRRMCDYDFKTASSPPIAGDSIPVEQCYGQ